jgi:hypothetical protein
MYGFPLVAKMHTNRPFGVLDHNMAVLSCTATSRAEDSRNTIPSMGKHKSFAYDLNTERGIVSA